MDSVVLSDQNTLALYVLMICLAIVFIRIFIKPIKLLFRLALSSALGGAALLIANSFGGVMGIPIGINAVTCGVCGILGVPGFIMLILLRMAF